MALKRGWHANVLKVCDYNPEPPGCWFSKRSSVCPRRWSYEGCWLVQGLRMGIGSVLLTDHLTPEDPYSSPVGVQQRQGARDCGGNTTVLSSSGVLVGDLNSQGTSCPLATLTGYPIGRRLRSGVRKTETACWLLTGAASRASGRSVGPTHCGSIRIGLVTASGWDTRSRVTGYR